MEEKKTYRVPEARLFATALPAETKTYKPVSHRELADTTLNAIVKAGFTVGKEQYSSAKDGNVANARYTITDVRDSEMQLEIGWQNSYDKTLSLKFAIGTRIFICDNGCVSGDLGAFKKAHRGDIKDFTPEAIVESIKSSGDTFRKIQKQRDDMKEIEVSKRVQAELLGRIYVEEELIKGTQLTIIKKELKHPTFDYKCEGSLWELYNHATFAMREIHPSNWMRDHIRVHKFFTEAIPEFRKVSPPSLDVSVPGIVGEIDPDQVSILDVIGETDV